jgi:hypothetical protein
MDASPYLARLMGPVTAVVVVVVVILLLIWINGGSSGSGQSPAAVGPGPVSPTKLSPPPHHSAAATPSPHHSVRATPSLGGPTHPASKPPGQPTATIKPANHKRGQAAAMAPVTVLNNSTRTGLAHAVAAEVQAKGWQIGAVGNLEGVIAQTTVYYAPGDAAAARHLAADFSSIQRVSPNRAGNIHGNALTLVVTRYWTL